MLPVIVLTARGLEHDKIRGLELGADDYMTKPFSPRELVLRIQTVLRRSAPPDRRPGLIERGDLRIDLAARQVHRGGAEVRLTPTEFNLLVELANRAGQAISHEDLLTSVWGPEYRTEGHYLKVYIGRLRDKIETDPASPRVIQTVRGVGYRLALTKD
jgi:two-component system KDP operon response regulator KdpE